MTTDETGSSRRLREALYRIFLAVAAAAVALSLAELLIRVVAPQPVRFFDPNPYVADGDGAVRFRPGYRGTLTNRTEFTTRVTINSLGLRGPEPSPPGTGDCRLLAIGDSQTFGAGVEDDEAFIEVAAAELRREGTELTVLNGGIPGLGVPQEIRWLERHGTALTPDVVVLGIFVGNDLLEATREWSSWDVVEGRLIPVGSQSKLKDWLFFHSHLYALLKNRIPIGLQSAVRARLGLPEPWTVRQMRAAASLYEAETNALAQEAMTATGEALDRFAELARERAFAPLALVIPDLIQLDPQRWADLARQLDLPPASHDLARPNRLLLEQLAGRGIPALDLLPSFRTAQAEGASLYFPIDRHLTVAGQRLAADGLVRLLHDTGTASACTASTAPGRP
jgi:lysophospholipase L1-like esterase